MKIGLSYSRCLLDIYHKKVDVNDVLVIIARTNFDPKHDAHWDSIWDGYTTWNGPWQDYYSCIDTRDEFRELSVKLQETGKLHQPRMFGARPFRTPYIWLDAILMLEDAEQNPAVKEAWDQLNIIAGLSNVNLNNKMW